MTKVSKKCKCGKIHEVEFESTPRTTAKKMKSAEKDLDQKIKDCKHE